METINYDNSQLILPPEKIQEGSITWRSPSNLAIIKYWGKYGKQLPRNPSLSLTLDKAYTETTIHFTPKSTKADGGIALQFFFEDRPQEAFAEKVRSYFAGLASVFPFLEQLDLVIRSRNSFPHSSGIASSASSMSALALCLCAMERDLFGTLEDDTEFRRKASFLARLGSGSACRSVYPKAAVWGETGEIRESSNYYAVPYTDKVHEVFHNYHDDILIVSKGTKAVSSRAGHALMDENEYAANRYAQARRRFHQLLRALATGDVELFGKLAEAEALTLHALMMLSQPPYLLLKPNTITLIEKITLFRDEQQLPLYFSLDAGPNLHLLYPDAIAAKVQPFIQEELAPLCENGQVIADQVGDGPIQL